MLSFEIPYPPTKKGKSAFCKRFGLNAYYSGKHYQARKRDADELHMMATAAMARAGIEREIFRDPVSIRFYWDDGLDVDNHAVMGKAFVDAMKGYIIADDSRKWLRKVSHEFWGGGAIRVDVIPAGDVRGAGDGYKVLADQVSSGLKDMQKMVHMGLKRCRKCGKAPEKIKVGESTALRCPQCGWRTAAWPMPFDAMKEWNRQNA